MYMYDSVPRVFQFSDDEEETKRVVRSAKDKRYSYQYLLQKNSTLSLPYWVLGSIPGLATYFRFSFCFFKKGSCQLQAKVCARSTG